MDIKYHYIYTCIPLVTIFRYKECILFVKNLLRDFAANSI